MSTALYRRYRPETFADVIGQEHVTGPLMAALDNGRVTHAYLFSGPRGCGKTTSARIFARCLNCANGPTSTPCGTCDSCVDLARGGAGSIDVVEMDAASHGGVDDARELRERAAFAPARDRFKVFIIDEAHMVSTQGFNALLKLVEEPPPHVKFVFATTEPEKVIGTIRSRTHHYPFRLVPPEQLTGYLESLAEIEGVRVDSGVLPLVVRAGGGSVRDSLSVLDQLIAGTDDGALGYERAVALLGFTHGTLLDDTVDALAARDGASLFRVVDRVIESGHAPRRFVEDLLERLRDLIVVRAAGEQAGSVLRAVPADQLERMSTQASHLSAATLSRAADLVNEALTEMAGATSPRLQLELLCARLLLPAADDGADGFAVRLDRIEGALSSGQVGIAAVGGPPRAASAAPSGPATPAPAAPGSAAAPPAPPAATAGAPSEGPPPSAADTAAPEVDSAAAASGGGAGTAPDAGSGGVGPGDAAPADQSPAAADAASGNRGAEDSGAAAAPASARGPQNRPDVPMAPPAMSESAPPASQPAPASSEVASAAPAPPAPEPGPGAGAGGLSTAEVRRRWPEVLDTLARIKRTTWALISQDAQIVDLDASTLQLGFSTSGLASAFRNGQHTEFLQRALVETLGLDVRIEPIVADGSSGAGGFGGSGGPGGGPGGSSGPGGRPGGPGGSPSGAPGSPAGAGAAGSGATSWDVPATPPEQAEASWAAPAAPGGHGPAGASAPPPWDVSDEAPSDEPEGDSSSAIGLNTAGAQPVPRTATDLASGPAGDVPASDPSTAAPASSPAEAAPASGFTDPAPGSTPGGAADTSVADASPPAPPWGEPGHASSDGPVPTDTGSAASDPAASDPATGDPATDFAAPAAGFADPAAGFADPAAGFADPAPAPPTATSGPAAEARPAASGWSEEPQRPGSPNQATHAPPSGSAPGATSPREQALAAAREARGASLSRQTPATSAPEAPDPVADYDPDPDDPDLESTGLAGAPLVARLLGGTVIDEILESPEGGDR